MSTPYVYVHAELCGIRYIFVTLRFALSYVSSCLLALWAGKIRHLFVTLYRFYVI